MQLAQLSNLAKESQTTNHQANKAWFIYVKLAHYIIVLNCGQNITVLEASATTSEPPLHCMHFPHFNEI